MPACSSYVGFVGGENYQTLQLSPDICLSSSVIHHEMIHTLGKELNFTISLPFLKKGFKHEHSRPDRDEYIDVRYKNIPLDKRYNYDKMPANRFDSFDQPYDLKSIMHYGGVGFLSEEARAAGERGTIFYKGTDVL